jgi:hypothetical protein
MKMILKPFFDLFPVNILPDENPPLSIKEKIIIVGSVIFAVGVPWGHVFGYIGAGIALLGAILSPGFLGAYNNFYFIFYLGDIPFVDCRGPVT